MKIFRRITAILIAILFAFSSTFSYGAQYIITTTTNLPNEEITQTEFANINNGVFMVNSDATLQFDQQTNFANNSSKNNDNFSITVDLKPETNAYAWQESSVTTPMSSITYESTNTGAANTCSVMKVTVSGLDKLTCYINSYAESSFDYTIASTLDATSYSSALATTSGRQYDPNNFNETSWTTVTYDNLNCEQHFFYIAYRKDGSVNRGTDKGYFVVDDMISGHNAGGALYNNGQTTFNSLVTFESNQADYGGAIYNNQTVTFLDGAIFKNNLSSSRGGAIYNTGTLNLTANTNNVEFTGNTANGVSNSVYNKGTINLWASNDAKIIFNDQIINEGSSVININKTIENEEHPTAGTVEIGADMSQYTGNINLYSGTIKLCTSDGVGTWFNNANTVTVDNATIDSRNNVIQETTLNNLSVTNNLYLAIDVNTDENVSDTYKINGNNSGTILLSDINLIGDFKVFEAKVLDSTEYDLAITDELKTKYSDQVIYATRNEPITTDVRWNKQFYVQEGTGNAIVVASRSEDSMINDSVKISLEEDCWQDTETIVGDTLKLINNYKTNDIKNFNFVTAGNKYDSTEDLGNTFGTLNVNGKQEDEYLSTIYISTHEGFVLNNSNSKLVLSNVKLVSDGTMVVDNKEGILELNDTNIIQGLVTGNITNNGTLTISANNLGSSTEYTLTNNGTLNLLEGTLNKKIEGTGNIYIKNEVTNNTTISNNLEITELGTLRTTISNVTKEIINNGSLYLNNSSNRINTGYNSYYYYDTLNRTIFGNGTTYLNCNLHMQNGSKIEGTLNLNNGKILTNKNNDTITEYEIGALEGTGELVIKIDTENNQSDSFNIQNDSQTGGTITLTGVSLINGDNPFEVQILKGGNVNLAVSDSLKNNYTKTELISTQRQIKDSYDWDEGIEETKTYLKRTLTLLQSIEDGIYDTLQYVKETLEEINTVSGNVLSLLNTYSTDQVKNFNFKSAQDIYYATSDMGTTVGTLNINGVKDDDGNMSTIDFQNKYGFVVSNGSKLCIYNTKLINAYARDGGTINNSGIVEIGDDVQFINNRGFDTGGAIRNSGTITFGKNILFSGNSSGKCYANRGGAIYNTGTMTFEDGVSFINNIAQYPTWYGSYAGAISNSGTINFIAKTYNVEFTGNWAFYDNTSGISNYGTINLWSKAKTESDSENYQGIIFNNNVKDGTFNINKSVEGTDYPTDGKVIFNATVNSTVNLYGGTLQITGAYLNTLNIKGGTLSSQNDSINGTTTISNLTATQNNSLEFDAKLKEHTTDTFKIANQSGILNITKINNIEDEIESGTIKVFVDSNVIYRLSSSLNTNGYMFLPGTELGTIIYMTDDEYSALYNNDNGLKVALESSTIDNYTMQKNEDVRESLETVTGSEFTIEGNGNNIVANTVSGMKISQDQTLNINNVGDICGFVSKNGGAIYNNGGTINIEDTTMSQNVVIATLYADETSTESEAEELYGGAIYNNSGTITFSGDIAFNNNKIISDTNSYGGAIYNNIGTINFLCEDNTISFVGNSARIAGAIFNNDVMQINANSINMNKNVASNGNGGAIYNTGTLTINGTDIAFNNNTASSSGGAISNTGTLEINATNVQFNGNSASNGSAIYNTGTITFDANTKFVSNSNYSISNDGGTIIFKDGVTFNTDSATIYNTGTIEFLSTENDTKFTSGTSGNTLYNRGTITFHDGASFNTKYWHADINNDGGTLNIITETKNFTNPNISISNSGTINLWSKAKTESDSEDYQGIIFNSYVSGGTININQSTEDNNYPIDGKVIFYASASSTVNLYDGTLQITGNSISNLNLKGGKLSSQNNGINGAVYLENINADSNNTIAFDANLKEHTSDTFTISNQVGILNITEITNISEEFESGSIKVFNDNNIVYKLSDQLYENNSGYVFIHGLELGTINYMSVEEYEEQYNTTNSLKTALQSSETGIYNMEKHEYVKNDLCALENDVFTIQGNNKDIVSNDTKGITLSQNQTLNINNVNNIYGFVGGEGGLIYNDGGTINLENTNVLFNFALEKLYADDQETNTAYAGAIYNNNGTISVTGSSSFNYNKAVTAGAIYNDGTIECDAEEGTIDFNGNTASSQAGAIYNNGTVNVTGNINFKNNKAENGGAIYNVGTLEINGTSTFKENESRVGGAIYNTSTGVITLDGETTFESNHMYGGSGSNGGAIHNEGIITIKSNANFINNSSTASGGWFGSGGAIYNTGTITFEDGATFTGNSVADSTYWGKYSYGGAIYNTGTLNLTANTNNVEFTGNSSTYGGGIYNSGTINFWVSDTNKILFNDRIQGSGTININKTIENEDHPTTGTIELNANMGDHRGTVNFYEGTAVIGSNGTWFNNATTNIGNVQIDTRNNKIDSTTLNNLQITNNLYLTIDIDTDNKTTDTFYITGSNTGDIIVTDMNLIGSGANFEVKVLTNGNFNLVVPQELKDRFETGYSERVVVDMVPTVKSTDKIDVEDRNVVYQLTVLRSKDEGIYDTLRFMGTNTGWMKSYGDTLNLINVYDTTETKNFNFENASDEYTATVDTGDTIGELYINGVTDNEILSTINLSEYNGFVVGENSSLNISNVKFTGEKNLITNYGGTIIFKDTNTIEGKIKGIGTTNNIGTLNINADNLDLKLSNTGTLNLGDGTINKSIEDVGTTNVIGTVVNNATISNDVNVTGTLTTAIEKLEGAINNEGVINASGTLNKELLGAGKTNVNNLLVLGENAKIDGTLNLNEGTIKANDNKITQYDISTLEGNGNVKIDLDLTNDIVTSDNFNILNLGLGGTLTISKLDITGNFKDFSVQVLNGGNVNLEVSQELKDLYALQQVNETLDELLQVVKWNDELFDTKETIIGTLDVVKSQEDGIYDTLQYETIFKSQTASQGDTLNLINISDKYTEKTFKFEDSTNVYKLNTNAGTTSGKLVIEGVADQDSNVSTIDLQSHNGFEIGSTSEIEINSTKLENGLGINGGAINNNGTVNINSGVKFINNSSEQFGGAIYNTGTVNLKAYTNDIEFSGNKVNGISNAIENVGTVNLFTNNNSKIIFNDKITGTGTININDEIEQVVSYTSSKDFEDGVVILNENMEDYTGNINLYSGTVSIDEQGTWFNNQENLNVACATIDMINEKIQTHNFNNLTVTNSLYLTVDVDLENAVMDTIIVNNFEKDIVDRSIEIRDFNLLTETEENMVTITFTESEEIFNEIFTDVSRIETENNHYDVIYNDDGTFTFYKNGYRPEEVSKVVNVAQIGGYIMQSNVMNQAFTSMEQQKLVSKIGRNNKYKLEDGMWIRPFGMQETVQVAGTEIETKSYGTLAGIDFEVGDKELLNVYIGVAGSKEELGKTKVNQTGYVFGASYMHSADNWYIGLTANVGTNKATVKDNKGQDEIEMMMYSIGLKAAYDIEFTKAFSLEPGVSVWYGNSDSKEYDSERNFNEKISSQVWNNIEAKPILKAKFNLKNMWTPYAYASYAINLGDKAEDSTNRQLDEMGKDGYLEYGIGCNKKFGKHFDVYLQGVGRNCGRNGVGANAGVKINF